MEFLTGCASAIAGEAGNSLLSKSKKHIGYLLNHNDNINGLKVARDELDAKRADASRFADDAKNRKFKDVSSTVSHWQSEADKLSQKAQSVVLANSRSPWSCYSSSKNAWKLTQEINEKVRNARDFGTTFNPPAMALGAKFDLAGFAEFESRLSIVDDIWEALKDEKVSLCSICGMGGVGKTTLAKKLIQRAEAHNLFDNVAMAAVSQNPDPMQIRHKIVSCLGWEFESGELGTSDKLHDSLMSTNKRILLVLDDVWEELDFEEIGIPKSRVKILLTSRQGDVCKRMGSAPNFPINAVTDEEAWDMFREIAKEPIEKWQMHDIAREISDECGGLPIVIVTVATALKFEAKATWSDSLLKLQKSNLLGIIGMEKVYSRIQLSYDLLKVEEQLCFRLCCLFPEDMDISIHFIIWYAMGLQIFEDVNSMEEVRNRVESIVDRLKNSFLLLDGDEDDHVKMHDILRDFAISVSSKDKNPFVVRHEEAMKKWPYENCSAISLVCHQMKEYPVGLRYPKLDLLQISFSQVQIPIGFFEGMTELKVLVFLGVKSLSEPVTALKKLRTLIIGESSKEWDTKESLKIGDLLGHGVLKDLEILHIATTRPCHDFPVEIGLLRNLRSLGMEKMKLKYIPPGVFSELVNLEYLELPREFVYWGCKERGGERVNAGLNEIESLPLTTLNISALEGSILGAKLVENLTRFEVRLFGKYCDITRYYSTSEVELRVLGVEASQLRVSWISSLLIKCESLILIEVRNLENLNEVYNKSHQLKYISIVRCNEMEYMVDTRAESVQSTCFSQVKALTLWDLTSLKEIWQGFRNLSEIEINSCPELKYVFTLLAARELRQLQKMKIWCCDEMEEIIYHGENQIAEENIAEVDHEVVFPLLKILDIRYMKKLRVLYDGNYAIELPSLEELTIKECREMKALSGGLFKAPRLKQVDINGIKYPVEEDLNAFVKETIEAANDDATEDESE